MKRIGSLIAYTGIYAIVIKIIMNRDPSFLGWIYNWGDTVAWLIKIGLVVIGAILYFMGGKSQEIEE